MKWIDYLHRAAQRTTYQRLFLTKVSLYSACAFGLIILPIVSGAHGERDQVTVTSDILVWQFTARYYPGDQLPDWKLSSATVRPSTDTSARCRECVSYPLKFKQTLGGKAAINIVLSRWPGEQLRLAIGGMTPEALDQVVVQPDGPRRLPSRFTLYAVLEDKAAPHWTGALPARLLLGAAPTTQAETPDDFSQRSGRLIRGAVTTEVASLPLSSGTIRTETILLPGDQLRLLLDSEDTGSALAISHSVMLASDSGIRLLSRSLASTAVVERYGDATVRPIALGPPFWARIMAQQEWILLVGIFLTIRLAFGAWETYCRDVWPPENANAQLQVGNAGISTSMEVSNGGQLGMRGNHKREESTTAAETTS